MRGFHESNCRLCQKVFCCRKCRLKHEKNFHKVVSDCDLCIYGKFVLANLDDDFLLHLESSHLPVHCVYCKKVFTTVEDLLQHRKCDFQSKEHSPKTPFKGTPAILLPSKDHDSPILQELQRQEHLNRILATSTPMQRGEEPLMFEKSKEVITPVDKSSRIANKSIIKKTDSAKSDEQLSKRRVTFGDTPANTFEKDKKDSIAEDQETTQSYKVLDSLDSQSLNQKSNENVTPVTGISTGQFYSAKTEAEDPFYSAKTNVSSKPVRDNTSIKNSVEGFTPVGILTRSKLINVKGDIYKNEVQGITTFSELKHSMSNDATLSRDNLDEVSMELCTPATHVNSLSKISNGMERIADNIEGVKGNETQDDVNFCTPGKTSNPENIVIKNDIYKNSEQKHISPITQPNQQNEKIAKNSNQDKHGDDLETKQKVNGEEAGHDTLWLSAINLEDSNDSEEQNENDQLPKKYKPTQDKDSLPDTPVSPQRTNQKRVSIVMPTPILKTTNVQMKMKFNFPAHLSSTPIMSSGAVKLNQTKIVKDISTRVIQQQTPYKTPQGKLYDVVQRRLIDANFRRNLVPLPAIEAGPSTSDKGSVSLKDIKEDYPYSETSIRRDIAYEPVNIQYEDNNYSSMSTCESPVSVSVSSMTESSLWTSMTRIVKSVILGGFGSISKDSSNISITNNVSSCKRQLSDSDSSDLLEAPRLKRFKFTDIKCRRTIRDLPDLELAPAPSMARIEITKSVSTLYGHQAMRIQCDKATQTDNYLMYGWRPNV